MKSSIKIGVIAGILAIGIAGTGLWAAISGNVAVSVVDPTNSIKYYTVPGDTTSGMWVNVKNTSISVTQGTSPWVVGQSVAANLLATVTQGTSPWVVSGTVTANQGTAAAIANSWGVKLTDTTQTLLLLTRGTKLNDIAIPTRPIYNRSQVGAFGSLMTASETPEVFVSFPYTVNTRQLSIVTTNTGTVTQTGSLASMQTGTNSAGQASIQTKSAVRYTPGQGIIARFTAKFTACVASSTQEAGIGDSVDGFFFACNGNAFSINRRQNGSNNYVAQASWNGDDKLNGAGPSAVTLNIANGNVYIIQYQWLGFGAINFFIETPNGDKALVHTIQYPNSTTTPSVFNGNLPLRINVVNSGNTTNLIVSTASMGIYTEGPRGAFGVNNAFTQSVSNITTTDQNMFTLRNNSTLNSVTNRTRIRLQSISIRNATTLDLVCKIILNGTEAGSPSFTDISTTTSIAATDVAGTTVSGGTLINIFSLANEVAIAFDLSPYNYRLDPGDTYNFTCATESGTTGVGRLGVSWLEEF